MRFLRLAFFLSLPVITAWVAPAIAQEQLRPVVSDAAQQSSSPSVSDIEHQIRIQDRQIFIELVKLAEFNIRYQQTVNHCARWRNVFYPLAQEAGYAGFLGYSLSDIQQRGRAWNNLRLISSTTAKRALSSATVGAVLGGTSSLIQLAADVNETRRANERGFSMRQSVSFVQSTVKQIDDMIARRHALMEEGEFTGTRRELLELKEQLLKYERDRLVFEFKRWSAHARGYAWYKRTFYAINATVNMGRFSAVQLGFKSFTEPRCSGATGPILIASAFLAGMGPLASSAVGNYMEHYQRRAFAKELPVPPFLSDKEAKEKFDRLTQLLASSETNSQHVQLASELVRMRAEKLGLDTLIFHEEKNIQHLHRVAGQQTITAPLISSLGLGSATLGTIGYYGYRQQPLISNRLSLAGDATIIPAEAVALVATPAAAILAYRYEHDLKKKGEHPTQLLSKRLADLKELETIVTNAWR